MSGEPDSEQQGSGDELDPDERALADTLSSDRAVPSAAFRGALTRHVAARDPGFGPRPERMRAIVAGGAGGGLLLMLVGALQATGVL
jgi:hypothetical protein